MQGIFEREVVSDDYCNSIIMSITKKQKANTCDQFKTLSLLTHALKILTKIINRCIENNFIKKRSIWF